MIIQKNKNRRRTTNHLKMQILIVLLLVAGMTCVSKNAFSQVKSGGYTIYGVVIDSATNKPLPSVTIELGTDTGRTLKRMMTKTDGSFVFMVPYVLTSVIKIVAVGYRTKMITVDGTDSSKKTGYLGRIPMRSMAGFLGDVVVMATKPLVRQETDRIIYDMQADPESKSSSVWEMMRKVPFLSVDGDDNILLKGSTGYKILINGKPSGMIERNPTAILRSMPASTIISIEVITSPSSKYDAEGLAGIINIVTSKKMDNGYTGTINLNYRFPYGGPGAGGFVGFKQGKFGISVMGGANGNTAPVNRNFSNRVTKGDTLTNLNQNSTREADSKTAYVGTELSYEIDSLHLISAQFNRNGNRTTGLTDQQTLLTAAGSILQRYDIVNNNNSRGEGTDMALNYQLGFKKSKERLLTLSYRYLEYSNHQFAGLDVSNAIHFKNPDYRQANEGRASEQTFQLDYVQMVKKVAMEAGVKSILRKNSSDFQYHLFDSAKGNYVLDKSRTNTYRNDQHILAAYNTYQFSIKSWGFKAGLRIEQTMIDGDFISNASQVKQQYLSIIPSATINRKFKNRSSLNASYTNRIQRPGINQLNPFIDRSNPSFESAGNPKLKPAYTNVFQLSYTKSKKATVNIALGCMLLNDLISPVSVYDSVTNITRTTFDNIGSARILKTNIYVNYPITKNGSVRLNSDIRHISSKTNVNKVWITNAGWNSYVNVSGAYRFQKGWRLNADLTLNSGGISGVQAKSNGFTGSTFNVQKDFEKSKITLSAAVNNPITRYRYKREEITGPDFTQINSNELYYRSFTISLNYRFGKLKDTIKKNKRGINNDDATD